MIIILINLKILKKVLIKYTDEELQHIHQIKQLIQKLLIIAITKFIDEIS